MCDVLLKDPLNRLWQMSIDNQGLLLTTLLPNTMSQIDGPTIASDPTRQWHLSAELDGTIVSTFVPPTPLRQILNYIPMKSPNGGTFKIQVDSSGLLLSTVTAVMLPDSIPYPFDVTMSRWPDSIGVTCPACANATVSVLGDLACWCCVCNAFVKPEDTTILVILDE